jgi:hypothetical protein
VIADSSVPANVSGEQNRFSFAFAGFLLAAFELRLPRGTPENRPMRDASKPANGIEAGQKHLYPTADSGDKKKVHIRSPLSFHWVASVLVRQLLRAALEHVPVME